jgi:hypothetical protein
MNVNEFGISGRGIREKVGLLRPARVWTPLTEISSF